VIRKKAGKFGTNGKITRPCATAIQQAVDAILAAAVSA
jgi:hypothetical protein